MPLIFAIAAAAAAGLPPVPPPPPLPPRPPHPQIHPNLFVTVGPGVTLKGSGPHVEFECTDDATCQFEIATGTRVALNAWTASGRIPAISGCTAASGRADSCVISIGNGRAVLSVR